MLFTYSFNSGEMGTVLCFKFHLASQIPEAGRHYTIYAGVSVTSRQLLAGKPPYCLDTKSLKWLPNTTYLVTCYQKSSYINCSFFKFRVNVITVVKITVQYLFTVSSLEKKKKRSKVSEISYPAWCDTDSQTQ